METCSRVPLKNKNLRLENNYPYSFDKTLLLYLPFNQKNQINKAKMRRKVLGNKNANLSRQRILGTLASESDSNDVIKIALVALMRRKNVHILCYYNF